VIVDPATPAEARLVQLTAVVLSAVPEETVQVGIAVRLLFLQRLLPAGRYMMRVSLGSSARG